MVITSETIIGDIIAMDMGAMVVFFENGMHCVG